MADSTKNKDNKSNKKKKTFFKDVKAELKKVTWPTAKQVVNNTVGVIIIVIITSIIVFALDFTFKNFNEYVVKGLKEKVSAMSVDNTVSDNTITEGTENNNENVENAE